MLKVICICKCRHTDKTKPDAGKKLYINELIYMTQSIYLYIHIQKIPLKCFKYYYKTYTQKMSLQLQ